MPRIHLHQELNTNDDSFTYTPISGVGPVYFVDRNGQLFKDGVNIGNFRLSNGTWSLYIGDELFMTGPDKMLFGLPEFELKALTTLVNKPPAQALEDIMVWPCGTWAYREEMYMMQHMSDDYQTLYYDTVAYNEFLSVQGPI